MPNTQKEEVLAYIRKNGSITRLEAAQLYIFELSARIGELERMGYVFNREDIGGTNKYGRKWKGVRYRINERKTREAIRNRLGTVVSPAVTESDLAVMP